MAWSALGSGAAAIGGALIGGGSSLAGDYFKYRWDKEGRQDQNDFSERMSSSAYQRAVVDMRKAGLNPALAYSQGGASTPTASQFSGSPDIGNDVIRGASAGASAASQAYAQSKQIDAQTELLKAQADKTKADTANVAGQTALQMFTASASQQATSKSAQEQDFAARLFELQKELLRYQGLSAKYSAEQMDREAIPERKRAEFEKAGDFGFFDTLIAHFLPFMRFSAKR